MRRIPAALLFTAVTAWAFARSARCEAPLTVEERVSAQAAIERVWHAHRVAPDANLRPGTRFAEAVPASALGAKVADYLKKSIALGKMARGPLTGEELQAEMYRMARDSKDPGTLREIFEALGDDPTLVAECLVRPALAEALLRESRRDRARTENGSPGGVCDDEPDAGFDRWWADAGRGVEIHGVQAAPGRAYTLPALGVEGSLACTETWSPTSTGTGVPAARGHNTSVWTGAEMIVWGGELTPGGTKTTTGGRYYPATDTWLPTSTAGACPSSRLYHTAVWTGSEMIIWGGMTTSSGLNDGSRYDPVSDTWTPVQPAPLAGRGQHVALWTGTHMVVWGGEFWNGSAYQILNTGGRYRPADDTWAVTSTADGCPSARYWPVAVWTGREMIVWGGQIGASPYVLRDGARYNPRSDSWSPVATGTECPSARYVQKGACVWTGSEMIVWGGADTAGSLNSGGRYNPATDAWTRTSTGTGCPSVRQELGGVWTGKEMIVWGGKNPPTTYFYSGARYDPAGDTWVPTSTGTGCPTARMYQQSALWAGDRMIVWAGYEDHTFKYVDTGGVYGPYAAAFITGPDANTCPARSVTLTASPASSYQWLRDGAPVPGATGQTFEVSVPGTYRVMTADSSGCVGTSSDKAVSITFCTTSEVSPTGAFYPLRIEKSADSPTGYYIYFQKIYGATAYNLYAGDIGTYYSHGGGTLGSVCHMPVEDLGDWEMRAGFVPPAHDEYFLVTATKGVAEGPSGFDSEGNEIPASLNGCTHQ